MRVVMVMFDSLNRHMLPPYNADTWVIAPNFQRLAQRTVTFERSYVCSMPCMPARRDLHTGRPNFLHRGWGPLEPFDDSVPELLARHGVSTHLITDHYHYFEDGGATYHPRYSTYQFFRGQEGDPWMGQAAEPSKEGFTGRNARDDAYGRQDRINRQFMRTEADQPQAKTMAAGIDFLRRNHQDDNWFVQIETFDPHEPFFTQRHYQDLYRARIGDRATSPLCDWPAYGPCPDQSAEMSRQLQGHYAALVTMCDKHLGDVLDVMDELEMWDDTMLIVCTDHGFLLGEHEFWAKCLMPFYEEVAHTPFFVWDPRSKRRGERRTALVQPALDIGPTLLEAFGVERTEHMTGKPLAATIARDEPVREVALFGIHGGQLNITDGRYVYMRAPADQKNEPLFNYTLMPTTMRSRYSVDVLKKATLHEGFGFTRGAPVLRTPADTWGMNSNRCGCLDTWLYDLSTDPGQNKPFRDDVLERRLLAAAVQVMQQAEAPAEQYERLGIAR